MKRKTKLIIGLPFIMAFGVLVYIFFGVFSMTSTYSEISKSIWSNENRIIIRELLSPDKKYKAGFYKYDSGALGYTTVNLSVIKVEDDYPIEGNILKVSDWGVDLILWRTSTELYIEIKPGYANLNGKMEKPEKNIINGIDVICHKIGK